MNTVNYANSKKSVEKIMSHIMEYFTDLQEIKNQITYIINPSVKDGRTYETLTYNEKMQVNNAILKMVNGGMFLVYNSDIIDFLISLELTNNNGRKKERYYYEEMDSVLDYYAKLIQVTLRKYI